MIRRAGTFHARAIMNTRTLAILVPFLALIGACGDSPSEPQVAAHVGTYNLQQLNGAALPVALEIDDGILTMRSGSLTLLADGRWSEVLTIDVQLSDGSTFEGIVGTEVGSYTLTGTVLRLTSEEGPVYSGTLQGSTLTYSAMDELFGVLTFRFQK
jgi:hypothetical protein